MSKSWPLIFIEGRSAGKATLQAIEKKLREEDIEVHMKADPIVVDDSHRLSQLVDQALTNKVRHPEPLCDLTSRQQRQLEKKKLKKRKKLKRAPEASWWDYA